MGTGGEGIGHGWVGRDACAAKVRWRNCFCCYVCSSFHCIVAAVYVSSFIPLSIILTPLPTLQVPQAAVDPNDPFGGIGVKPVQRQTEPLKKPPKWLRRPCAANFGVRPSVCLSVRVYTHTHRMYIVFTYVSVPSRTAHIRSTST